MAPVKRFSAELQVGLLVLTASLMLGGAYWTLADVAVGETYTVYVDYDNPEIMAPGAAVRVGGIEVGRVESIVYRGRRDGPEAGLVRMRLAMRTDTEASIREDATFTTTTQGVMSEQYIAVDPGTPERPPLEPGAIVRGIDSPRLDVVLADSFYVLETATVAMRDNRHELDGMFDDIVAINRAARSLSTDHDGDVETILENGRILGDEGEATIDAARTLYVDGERARRIARNLDRASDVIGEQGPELLRRGEAIGRDVEELSDTFGEEQRRQLDSTVSRAERIADAVERTRVEAEEIATHVEEGRGSIGAFRADEELNDDLLSTYRNLLHNPWRFFWRD